MKDSVAKKKVKIVIGTMATVLLLCAVFNVCIDPFFQYHAPWFELPVYLDDAIYQTAGAAKNLEYTDVLMGTSMTENFDATWFDEYAGWDTIKLSYSGARTDDLGAILNQVYEGDRQVNHVFMDIMEYQYTTNSFEAYAPRPSYLYDGITLQDVKYVWNYDVMQRGIQVLYDWHGKRADTMKTAYIWGNEVGFGSQYAFQAAMDTKFHLKQTGAKYDGDWESRKQMCEDNVKNITRYIEMHPETTFIFYVPPYSMLHWEQKYITDDVEGTIKLFRHLMELYLQYDNVEVHSFLLEKDIITNLDNYADTAHHTPEINRYIFECVMNGTNRITMDNIENHVNEFEEFALHFDYEAMWR